MQGMALAALMLISAPVASAQTTTQLWANLTLDWVKSDRLVYELDIKPKVLIAGPEGQPDWRNLDLTPNVEYSLKPWLDIQADLTMGRTTQTDDVDSSEVTPRVERGSTSSRAGSCSRSGSKLRSGASSCATWCASNHETVSTPAATRTTSRRSASVIAWKS